MPTVRVTIPTMLAVLVGGTRQFDVDASDIEGVLAALFTRHPELRVHVVDDLGEVRPHVMVFHNNDAVHGWRGPVADGDEVTLLQAVSGG